METAEPMNLQVFLEVSRPLYLIAAFYRQSAILRTEQSRFYELLEQKLKAFLKQAVIWNSEPNYEFRHDMEKAWKRLDQLICTNTMVRLLQGTQFNESLFSASNLMRLHSCRAHVHLLKNEELLLFRPLKPRDQQKLILVLQNCIDHLSLAGGLDQDEKDEPGYNIGLTYRSLPKETQMLRKDSCALHKILHQNSHEGHTAMFCEYTKAKLVLNPEWNFGRGCASTFNIFLGGNNNFQEGEICIKGQKPEDPPLKACQVEIKEANYGCAILVCDDEGTIWVNPPAESRIDLNDDLEWATFTEVMASRLALKDKRILAVVLGNCLLHLFNTPWLRDVWTKDDISFYIHVKAGNPIFEIRRPCLSTNFGHSSEKIGRYRSIHKFPSLVSFALVLLELELADRLEHLQVYQKYRKESQENRNANAMRILAKELLNYYYTHEYSKNNPNFYNLVQMCLDPEFLNAIPQPSYEDSDITNLIYVNIVQPLEQDLVNGHSEYRGDPQKELSALLTGEITALAYGWNKTDYSVLSSSFMGTQNRKQIVSFRQLEAIKEEQVVTSAKPTYSLLDQGALMSELFDSSSAKALEDNVWWTDEWFRYLQKTQDLLSLGRRNPLSRKDKEKRVKIAVLDTGIDLEHPLLKKYVGSGQLSEENCQDFVNESTIQDENGHGTYTAHLLLKTAPNASLFIARVFRSTKAEPRTPFLVAQAIKYAVEKWDVDIISMSFAFPDVERDIQGAIQDASFSRKDRGILMFAAASNNRHNEKYPIGYPAREEEYVVCVNSTDGRHNKSKFSPEGRIGSYNFSTVGEHVTAAWKDPHIGTLEEELEKCQSGTSSATPIAAGVAALILEFSIQVECLTGKVIENASKLRHHKGMTKFMWNLMTPKRLQDATYNTLQPWLYLQPSLEKEAFALNVKQTLEDILDKRL